jgi:hypothetical protein
MHSDGAERYVAKSTMDLGGVHETAGTNQVGDVRHIRRIIHLFLAVLRSECGIVRLLR